jgi:hypothetical protein
MRIARSFEFQQPLLIFQVNESSLKSLCLYDFHYYNNPKTDLT